MRLLYIILGIIFCALTNSCSKVIPTCNCSEGEVVQFVEGTGTVCAGFIKANGQRLLPDGEGSCNKVDSVVVDMFYKIEYKPSTKWAGTTCLTGEIVEITCLREL